MDEDLWGPSVSAVALRTDTLGGIYVAGAVVNSTASQGPSGPAHLGDTILPYSNKTMFLVKYDTMGTLQWLKMPQPDTISITSASNGGIYDMDVAPDGEIFLYCRLTVGSYDINAFVVNEMKMYVLKYNANGFFTGLTPMDITVSGTWQNGGGYGNLGGFNRKFSRDNHNGRYYLSGYYDNTFGTLSFGSTTFPDTSKFYLTAFDSAGNSLWTKMNTGNGNYGINSRPVIDEQGNVYVGGQASPGDHFNGYTFTNLGQSTVPFVIAADSNGNLLWGSNGKTTTGAVMTAAVAYANNSIGATGGGGQFQWDGIQVTAPMNTSYIFLARINAANGTLIGLDTIPSNSLNSYTSAITSDKNNNFFVGGWFADELYVAGNTLINSGGMYDWFVAKFGSANCNCTLPQPSFNYNTTGNNTYAFNYTGSTPYTSITWDFGDSSPASTMANPTHTYAASGTYHVCVTVTNNCGSNTSCQTIKTGDVGINNIPGFADINIYPNPTTQEIIIEHAAAGTILDIYNITGQRMLHTVLKGTKDNVNVSSLSSDIYLMRFTDKNGQQGSSKFVKQ